VSAFDVLDAWAAGAEAMQEAAARACDAVELFHHPTARAQYAAGVAAKIRALPVPCPPVSRSGAAPEAARDPVERDELIAEVGRVGGLLDCLAELVLAGDVTAARSMARAMRDGGAGGGVKEHLGDERPKLTGWAVQSFAMALAEHLDALGARNHVAWSVAFPAFGGKPNRRLDFVAHWEGGLTTADRIGRAEAERDKALADLAAARKADNDFRASLRPVPLALNVDLDAIEARAHDNDVIRTHQAAEDSAGDVPALCRELRRVAGLFAQERAVRLGYESGITWETSCVSCAGMLDSLRAAEARAEKAEAALAEAEAEAKRALDRLHFRVERAEAEESSLQDLVARQSAILTGVADALKGAPAPGHMHSHHDLAEVAAGTASAVKAVEGLARRAQAETAEAAARVAERKGAAYGDRAADLGATIARAIRAELAPDRRPDGAP